MVTTKSLSGLLKEKPGSDYQSARSLKISTMKIYQLQYHGGSLTDEQGLKAAEPPGFPADFVILSLVEKRSFNSPTYTQLINISAKFDPGTIAILTLFTIVALGLLMKDLWCNLLALAHNKGDRLRLTQGIDLCFH